MSCIALQNFARVACTAALALGIATSASRGSAQQVAFTSDDSPTALALCREADKFSNDQREGILMRGLAIAEKAVAADSSDAQAHFAVFCNLGKQIQSHIPGPSDVRIVGRLKRELDTALTLAPADPDLLAAKGALLLELPWLLGGDAKQGEELLRAALAKDPSNQVVRRYLTK